ncbi:MAG: histidine phosphatase family protein [Elusimicrobia bacterium]|nr:histidine phosphatase family protein [Elusimicrobiota bacterium]
MKLYLLRHGRSPSAAEAGVAKDFDRPLSDAGRAEVRKAALCLASRGARPSLILHSPLRRAVETAKEAATVLKPAPGLEAFTPLANALSAEELAARLRQRCAGLSEVLAVGHQPQLGELVEALSKAVFSLKPAGLVALELKAEEPAAFLWACNPEDLPVP